MYKFLVITALLVVLALVGVLALTSAQPRADVVLLNGAPVKNLDPARMSWMHDIRTAYGLWEGLLTTDPRTLAVIPGVAERYEISPDGRTYTFHLRADVRWSNGDPVVSGDFRFAWLRVLDPVNASDYYTYMTLIDGAEEYYARMKDYQAGRWGTADERAKFASPPPQPDAATVAIRCPDDRTLEVTLARPVAYFPELVAFATFLPLHAGSMQPFLEHPSNAPPYYATDWLKPPNLVSNGPFMLERWEFRRRLLLRRNPHYWDREHVPSQRIELRATEDPSTQFCIYQTGGADLLTTLPGDVSKELLRLKAQGERPDLHVFPVHGTYYYRLNCKQPPLDNVLVRRALASCVDRERIVTQITAGGQRAQRSFVTPGLFTTDASGRRVEYRPQEGPAFDPEAARRLLAEAGYPGGKGFPPMSLLFNTSKEHELIAQYVCNVWRKELGIDVRLEGLVLTVAGQRMDEHKFEIARSGWFTDYSDPNGFLEMFRSGDGNNDGQFDVPEYDRLLADAAAETDPAKRFAMLEQAEKILVDGQVGVIPVYQYVGQLLYRENITGIWDNPKQQIMLKGVGRK
ncbi:MAG: Oligopeptide-binding protein OppA [Phycisphaerae bacterium]|nr:Oligopeptide-binding protein OppA [Phycisphaerae bacterium]